MAHKLERFRTVQRSLQGQNELNEIRVRFNRLATRLNKDAIKPAIQELASKTEYIRKEDAAAKKIIKYCESAAIKESQQLHRASVGSPEEVHGARGGEVPLVWLNEFVRKTRQEVDEVACRNNRIREQVDGLAPVRK